MFTRAMRAFVLLLALVACASKPPACPVMPAVTQGSAFLWKVHKGDGPTLWLYGTVHDISLAGVPPAALWALDGSKRFASELGDADPDPEMIRELSRYRSGQGIDQTLPEEDWYDLRDTLAGSIKEDALRRARPWYALILLNKKVSPDKPTSMDVDLGKRAKNRKLPVDALETWKEQMTALDAVVTVADLSEAIRARDQMRCESERMRTAYTTGDLELMTALLLVPRTAEALLWARNRAWMPKLEAYAAPTGGGAFVAVGLGHMLGDNGLPALLARAGYTVERTP
jgi:uncharacterized protein YbaP (TraB family)